MKKSEIIKLILIGLGILAMLIVIVCSITIMIPSKRGQNTEQIDLNCVVERSRDPLRECKK